MFHVNYDKKSILKKRDLEKLFANVISFFFGVSILISKINKLK